ncbi:hypothetical protein UT300019_28100 [Clostridium sp. CTA-19]
MVKKRYGIILFLSVILGLIISLIDMIVVKKEVWSMPHSMKYLFLNTISMVFIAITVAIVFSIIAFIIFNSRIGSKFYKVYKLFIELISFIPYIAVLAILVIILGSGRKTVIILLTIYNIIYFSNSIVKLKENTSVEMINTATAMAMSKNEIFIRINILENKNNILKIILKGIRFNINILIISSIIGVYTLGSPIIFGFKALNIKLILVGVVPIAIVMLILSLLTEGSKGDI